MKGPIVVSVPRCIADDWVVLLSAAQSLAGGIFVNRCLLGLLGTSQGCREITAQWTPGPVEMFRGGAIPAPC